jgi:alkanesulfonate monooxygenase SsuD/methylene tetrahydromethanopterin reductase-like flavin-dependent oxidoreductase (luciferase family)
MKFGFILTGGSIDQQLSMARAAEAAGWDGVFTWDGIHLGDGVETHDPWVLMAAIAMVTERVTIGAMIQPLARRRPWKVASEAVTLDHVSGGRFVLCVGLGATDDNGWGNVGEPVDRRTRAEKLDETLDILTGLWTGEPFGFEGTHYRFAPMAFRPVPVQQPRIPIWVVGAWPAKRSMARAARFDGLIPQVLGGGLYSPEMVAAMRDWIAERREGSANGYDIVLEGPIDPGPADEVLEDFARAGATWWIHSDWSRFDLEATRSRIEAGPPRFVDRVDAEAESGG